MGENKDYMTYYALSATEEMNDPQIIKTTTIYCFFCGFQVTDYTGGVILGGTTIGDDGFGSTVQIAVGACCADELAYIAGWTISDQNSDAHKSFTPAMMSKFWKGVADGLSILARRFAGERDTIKEDSKAVVEQFNQMRQQLIQTSQEVARLKAPPTPDPQYCYLMRRPDGDHKIGISNDVDRRHDQIRRDYPGTSLISWFECDDMRQAEKILHDQFAAKRKDGEWFDLDADEVAYLMSINKFASGEFWQRAIPKSQPANQEKPF